MEPLCLVKSHEITQVTASVYSTVKKDSGVSSLKLGLVSLVQFSISQAWELKLLALPVTTEV